MSEFPKVQPPGPRPQEANIEIILKWVQTAILTTIFNLLYVFRITMLNTNYLIIFAINY